MFIFQIGIMFFLYYLLKHNAALIYLAIEVFSIIAVLELMGESRNSQYKIFWMIILIMLPIVGHFMFELWGKRDAHEKEHKRIKEEIDNVNKNQIYCDEYLNELYRDHCSKGKISSYLRRNGYPVYKNTEMEYFHVGDKVFIDVEKEIKRAQKFIFLCFFRVEEGEVWERIKVDLIEKAKAGVEIKIIYDDAGSAFRISEKAFKELQDEGVQIVRYNAVEKNGLRLFLNYRNHQRMIIIDGNIAYVGGMSLSDTWVNLGDNRYWYKGVAVKLTGDAVYSVTLIFLGMWATSHERIAVENYKPTITLNNNKYCQPFAGGPSDYSVNTVRDLYIHMINEADSFIYFMSTFLILDDTIRDMLILAAQSGIDVRIIVPGLTPRKVMKLVSESNYGELLKSGVKIYECNSGFMHAKMCVNDYSAVVGTVNMNFRSFYLNYECGVWTSDLKIVSETMKDYAITLIDCEEITYDMWKKRPVMNKVKQHLLNVVKSQL